MKKLLLGIGCYLSTMIMYPSVYAREMILPRPQTINTLMRFEAAQGDHTSQVVFEFLRPLYYRAKETKEGEQLKVYFPGMRLADFSRMGVIAQVKKIPNVNNVVLSSEKNSALGVLIPSPTLTIDFTKDVVILRLTKMEDPNLLIIDIYNKATLGVIKEKVTTILKASNDTMPSKKKRAFSPLKARVVIDPGHGGRDSGAESFGLNEKAITLDIARQVFSRLKEEGYRVFLTRNTDTSLSVVDRFLLAQQLKADLFVSVHVNAAAGVGKSSGIETHFLDGSPFLGPQKRSAFLFADRSEDKELITLANKVLHEKITASQALSHSIQQGILCNLREKNMVVENRGVKRTVFRTLLRSEVPSSIVEVGFLTNEQEAKLLTQPSYREILVGGICDGIKKYLAM
jgi:N-acetylmuramoyl-L-alanine amidase